MDRVGDIRKSRVTHLFDASTVGLCHVLRCHSEENKRQWPNVQPRGEDQQDVAHFRHRRDVQEN